MKVELSISGTYMATPNTFASVKLDDDTELGETEVIEGTTKPSWTKTFLFDYDPGQDRSVIIRIHDAKKPNRTRGFGTFVVGELLEAQGNTQLKQTSAGRIIAHAAKHIVTGTLMLQLRGKKLINVDGIFRKSDPFFIIEREGEEIFRSETVMDDLDPIWHTAEIELSALCGDILNLDAPLKVLVYDQERDGAHDFMGSFVTSINELLSRNDDDVITLMKGNKNTGQIHVLIAELVNFVDANKAAKAAMEIINKAEAAKVLLKKKEDNVKKMAVEEDCSQKAARIAAEEAEMARASLEELLAALDSF